MYCLIISFYTVCRFNDFIVILQGLMQIIPHVFVIFHQKNHRLFGCYFSNGRCLRFLHRLCKCRIANCFHRHGIRFFLSESFTGNGQQNNEPCSFRPIFPVFNTDHSLMQLYNGIHQTKPYACTRYIYPCRFRYPVERCEYLIPFLRWDSTTGIHNLQHHIQGRRGYFFSIRFFQLSSRNTFYQHTYVFAGRSILECIGQ